MALGDVLCQDGASPTPARCPVPNLERRTFLSRAALVCAAPSVLTACTDDTSITSRYRDVVRRVMRRHFIPGAIVSVRYPGDRPWQEAFGYANVASQTPIDLGSFFPIRSITKSFTVTMFLQLAAERLDEPIAPWFPTVPNADRITFAHLAGMRSGIANYTNVEAFLEVFIRDLQQAFTEQQIVDYAIPASPVFDPDAEYHYSNTNTILLGMFVARASGSPYADTLQRLILDPLGMPGTSYPSVVPLPDPHATPYEVDIRNGALEVLPLVNPTSLAGAGAMVSTLDDLQTWAAALGDGRLIGAALHAERIRRSSVVTNGPEYDRYGLGIGILRGWWGHTGSALGWQAASFYDPRSLATIAVSTNATPTGADRPDLNFAQEIFEAVAEVVEGR